MYIDHKILFIFVNDLLSCAQEKEYSYVGTMWTGSKKNAPSVQKNGGIVFDLFCRISFNIFDNVILNTYFSI